MCRAGVSIGISLAELLALSSPSASQKGGTIRGTYYDLDESGPDLLATRSRPAEITPPLPYPLAPRPKPSDLILDRSRDDLLTAFGKAKLTDRHLMPGESFPDMLARASCAYANDVGPAQCLYDAMSQLWFIPPRRSCPMAGPTVVCPISFLLNDVPNSLDGIVGTWNQNVWMASNGGGIGTLEQVSINGCLENE